MMNSAPAVVGASDGLAAFMSIIAKKGSRSCLGAGWRLRVGRVGPTRPPP